MGGVTRRSWNSENHLIFAHVTLTKLLGVHRAWEIWYRMSRRMNLWEGGLHAVLVGDAEAVGAAREGMAVCGGEEEDKAITRSYHDTVLPGMMRQAVHYTTDREGGSVSSRTTNASIPGNWLQRFSGRITRTRESPLQKIPCV